jgi:lipopolysaccharide export system permease protein
MHIIDRYLLRQYIQTFVICFLSLMGLYVVIEVTTNLGAFLRAGPKVGGVLPLIVQFYSTRWILLFEHTSGVLAMVSAMFTIAWIQRHNEMTALMAAGVSRMRVLAPIIAAVAVVSLLSAANREALIPRYRSELSLTPQDPLGERNKDFSPRYDEQTIVLLGGKGVEVARKRIVRPNFDLRQAPEELRRHGDSLSADSATYLPPQGNRPGGYLFEAVRSPKNLDVRPSLYLDKKPILITYRDAPDWLKPGQCFFASEMDFDQLIQGDVFVKFASTGQLISALHNPSLGYGADVRVAIHSRIIKPLLDMTLLFLGLPFLVTRESRSVFLAMGVSMAIAVAFILSQIALQWMGGIYLLKPPELAAWAPLMLFVPLAVGMADSLWK